MKDVIVQSKVIQRVVTVTIVDVCEDKYTDAHLGPRFERRDRVQEYQFRDPRAFINVDSAGELVSITIQQKPKRGRPRNRMGSMAT